MNKKTLKYLKGRFKDYYRLSSQINIPNLEQRELGFITWDDKMVRHKSKRRIGNIKSYVSNSSFKHMYYSSAKYKKPSERDMKEKERIKTDLIFDLDADHLNRVDENNISHPEMLKEVKKDLKNLVEIIEYDFNYRDFEIYFSGGRGYHLHIRNYEKNDLTSEEREELVSYIQGSNLSFEDILRESNKYNLLSEDINEIKNYGGWGRKTIEKSIDKLEKIKNSNKSRQKAREINGIGEKKSKELVNNINEELELLKLGLFRTNRVKKVVEEAFNDILKEKTANIDEPVTTDLNRLIRMPDSLHGKTGLKVTKVNKNNLDNFKPFREAIPQNFRNNKIKVKPKENIERILNKEINIEKEKVKELKEYDAIYLMLNDKVELN